MIVSILTYYNLNMEIRIELDASDKVINVVLS